jgi:hypothetical protein
MGPTNVTTVRIIAVFLFLAGAVLIPDPTWTLGLILAATVIGCTTVVVDEIRHARQELIKRLERIAGQRDV